MPKTWTDEELAAAIEVYRDMLRYENAGTPYAKRERYRALAARSGRTEKSFEYRMENISAVLAERGDAWLPGLKPAVNVGVDVKRRIYHLLDGGGVEASYRALAEPMRKWLENVARSRGVVTYGDVMDAFGVGRLNLHRLMSLIGRESHAAGEPIITALIVNKATRRCSEGLADEFGVTDDIAERERLYEYWASTDAVPKTEPESLDVPLAVKAARFVAVEARPDQAVFRRLVFLACGAKCVVSGCDVVEALDAAHRQGRDWRKGHNRAEDGYLLRKDLHALYDCGLLSIEDGIAIFDPRAGEHYRALNGTRIASAAERID